MSGEEMVEPKANKRRIGMPRSRESDKHRPPRVDKRQRIKNNKVDAETQTEPYESRLHKVAKQELKVVQDLAELLADTSLHEEVRTCGERLAMALHEGDDLRRALGPGG